MGLSGLTIIYGQACFVNIFHYVLALWKYGVLRIEQVPFLVVHALLELFLMTLRDEQQAHIYIIAREILYLVQHIPTPYGKVLPHGTRNIRGFGSISLRRFTQVILLMQAVFLVGNGSFTSFSLVLLLQNDVGVHSGFCMRTSELFKVERTFLGR